MRRTSIAILLGALGMASNVLANEELKIGLLSTLSGPGAALGNEIKDGFELALEKNNNQLGGVSTKLIVADDQQKADEGRQAAERLLRRDKVDLMTGMVFSNVLLPVMPRILNSDTIYVSTNTGPADYAGAKCHPNFFTVSWQNEDIPSAMGQYVTDKNHKSVFLIAPNYPGGKESIDGFKRYFKGDVADEVYVKLGQLDFAAEVAQIRASGADAVFFFLPGGMGVSFIKQLVSSGLNKQLAIYTPGFSADQDTIKAVGDPMLGMMNASQWSPDLDNAANNEFVTLFKEKYGRTPSMYAAQGYDAARLIDSAIKNINGDYKDNEKLRAEIKKANFDSVRGDFSFNNNNYPIQNYYMREVYKNENGEMTNRVLETIFEKYEDPFSGQCGL
ncbi:ABC transporter substrate-binding protein [uncultured Paenalcaligenes sp.]|uniref:ABC transporter substrate-binding protein n=1 Tax=uncultured Paenalcaligenes sp. TaxID=1588925 RepID=UPI00261FDC4B|nr:ABC transporter substrate-binding protein [uncultured Paenalcaligenes sp.]